MPHLQSRLFNALALTAMLALASALRGATAEAVDSRSTGDRMRERVLRMTEFFDTMLPGVLEENNMTLHFRPKFSDLRNNEYMRFPFELRYGLTEKWELQAGLVPFTPNVFNRGREHRWGTGEAKLGARYDIGAKLPFFDDTTVGVETRVPLGRPPIELNDHYTHVKPVVSAARTLRIWPSTTFYANLAYDRSVDLTHRSPPPIAVVRRNIIEAAPGFLYKPSELGYFTEYRFRHISEDAGWHLSHELQFGTIWDVPIARSKKWKLPGKWQLELAYKLGHEEGRGSDQGVSARVNWRTTLREVLAHGRAADLW